MGFYWLTTAVVFALGSVGLFRFSREALRDPRTYGFWRFFAFEAILVLALVALPLWFVQPLGLRQLASWSLLCPAAALAFSGYWGLRTRGRPGQTFEDTTVLVRSGIFRHIRHPMYASLLLLTWGLFLRRPGALTGALTFASSVCLLLAMRNEERALIAHFGRDYLDYRREVGALVPHVL